MAETPHAPNPSPTTRGEPDQPRAPDVYGSDATEAQIHGAPEGAVGAATPSRAPRRTTPEPPGFAPDDADIAADDAGASARTETPQAKP
jgi:hypothetical protein